MNRHIYHPQPPSRLRRAVTRLLGVVVVVVLLVAGAYVAVREVVPQGPTVIVVERCTATSNGKDYDLAPDQAGNAALIAAVAQRRNLPARASTIAIATARQESKLRNITYGDRDSLGLFQQRPSQGWGTAAEIQDPVHATNAFLDVLVKVPQYQSLPITEVAQRVQRSAFPAAYASHEPEARAYASALAGYSDASLTCRLRPVDSAPRQAAGSDGYWPRTAAVVARMTAERGPVAAHATGSGAAVVFGSPGSSPDAIRAGWSEAQWAVAHADDLQVIAVGTDGHQWLRSAPDAGWQTLKGAAASRWAPKGATVVVVAAGQTK